MSDESTFVDEFGPVVYLVAEFTDGKAGAKGFERLLDLVDQHVIRVLDMEFIRKRDDGAIELVEAHDVVADSVFDMAQFDGANSHLLTPDDVAEVGADLSAGSVAVIVIYEELALLPVIAAWASGGARLLSEGSIEIDDLVTALDETEA